MRALTRAKLLEKFLASNSRSTSATTSGRHSRPSTRRSIFSADKTSTRCLSTKGSAKAKSEPSSLTLPMMKGTLLNAPVRIISRGVPVR